MNVPVQPAEASLEVRKSRFLAFAEYLEHADDARDRAGRKREEHPGCNHVVWAFVCGNDGERFGSSDDREPRGSAGRPVLDVLRGSGLTNTLLLVVRYFGGIKLGIGGLVHAYGAAAKQVLELVISEPLVERFSFRLTVEYHSYDRIQKLFEELDVKVSDTVFDTRVRIEGALAADVVDVCRERVLDLTNGLGEMLIIPRDNS